MVAISTLCTAVGCGAAILGAIKLKRGANVADYLALAPVSSGTILRWLGILLAYLVAPNS